VALRGTIARRRLHAVPDAAPDSGPKRRDEGELIDAIQRGDERVSAEIYDRLIGVIDRTLYRVLGRREADHRDLVQSTFEQVVVTLSTGRFARACSLETWASVLATHIGLKALRSRRREDRYIERAQDPERESATFFTDAERQLDARAQLFEVRRHLAEMNPAQASTLFLHDGLGHNLSEIALMTGVSVAAAQSRLVRGRRELGRRLENAKREAE
jgi:RNA polymerase sigma-70 factor, ECF subfamily